jgi:hypothetical protein
MICGFIRLAMFDNEPTNPKLIVANILTLSDGWKALLGPDEQPPARKRRNTGKRSTRAKG